VLLNELAAYIAMFVAIRRYLIGSQNSVLFIDAFAGGGDSNLAVLRLIPHLLSSSVLD